MARPLGKSQFALMRSMAAARLFIVVGDKIVRSLARRGLLVARGSDGESFFQVTPTGLRFIADEMEAGRMIFDLPTRKDA